MESTQTIADALLMGRKRLVSRENDGSGGYVLGFSAASIRLSERELSILTAAERGVANKLVAIEQSLACSTVSESLQTAIAKLGFANRTEFLKVMAYLRSAGARVVGTSQLFWVFLPVESLNLDPRLTAAEREVVAGVLNGRSNAAIALARRTSTRTVANQLAAIYRKLGVASRWELAASAGRPRPLLAQAS
ncbi:MAG TPA: LuxR C-terminal-related transcriptional regulator [Polyangiaceae bacterium]|nr:LuxR C-terminal-related transcriptional regulator [Polyangiaceae bacterium]